jgi:signal transduction histidine kinase/CheY-like chemotaxis protein/HPt (histidine-containing phosphotransfer) domain-containing protein
MQQPDPGHGLPTAHARGSVLPQHLLKAALEAAAPPPSGAEIAAERTAKSSAELTAERTAKSTAETASAEPAQTHNPAPSVTRAQANTERLDAQADRTVASLRRAALALALVVATGLPAAQLFFTSQSLKLTLNAEVDQLASELSRRAARSPERWAYEINGLDNLTASVVARNTTQAVRVLDTQGRQVVGHGLWAQRGVISAKQGVQESGATVGRVELQASTAALWRGTLEVALGALLIALATWWLVAGVAIRSLEAAILRLRVVRAEAEAANTAKGAFLAAMSHEIRTPMNGVMGMAELLEHSSLDDEQSQTVRTIRESALSLLRIIDDILDFSKIEAGRLDLEEAPLLLTPLVEGVCDALTPVATARGVQLFVVLEPGVPERVVADAVRLRQVLNNLVGNAIKFSGNRPGITGRVALRVALQAGHVAGAYAQPSLLFSVTDNGIGIDDATLAKLFTPFTQAEVSTTRRFGGTGLGLAICRRLAELMGGSVAVQSRLGEGATFTVQLPLPATAEQPPALPHDLQGLRCVLVAGHGLPLDDLQTWLGTAHAEVHRASSLAEALALARELASHNHELPQSTGTGHRAGPVVLVRQAAEISSTFEPADPTEPTEATGFADLRHLLVGQGRQGVARLLSPTEGVLELLRQGAFLRAVAMVAGRASPEVLAPAPEVLLGARTGALSVEQARQRGQLILVAEDDAINRAVILRQLALLGLAAEVAEDGAQALRMWHQGQAQATAEAMAASLKNGAGSPPAPGLKPGRYALMLSDLHMPELDGYGLAQAIRQAERDRAPNAALARMPILALTANALKGEALRAREVGMDDYLTKPVPLKLLQAALKQWLPSMAQTPAVAPEPPLVHAAAHPSTATHQATHQATPAPVTTTATASPAQLAAKATANAKASAAAPALQAAAPWLHAQPSAQPSAQPPAQPPASLAAVAAVAPDLLNLHQLYQLVGDDEATVRELLGDFVAAAQHHVAELQGALRAGDNVHASRVAHKLKSAAQSVGAMALGQVCADIEARRDLAGVVSSQRLSDSLAQIYAATSAALAVQLQASQGQA